MGIEARLAPEAPDLSEIAERAGASPLALANIARTWFLAKGEAERARELCAQALAVAPDDGEIQAIHAEIFSAHVGRWYFSMTLDDGRHRAYDRALRRALAGGGRVLDIGTGTGLFAMMAARAGADEVITCEAYADVAGAARAVIARNGFQDRVKVVDKTSTQLKLGVDMSGPADVLVWDNLSNDMLGSGALPAVEDAMRRLVRPGGAVIPAGCAVRAALAEDRGLHRRVMGFVEGFDLSPFNILAKPGCTVDVGSGEVSLRSEAVTLFDFDLKSGGPFPAQRASAEVAGEGGRANGLLQWLDFRLDDEERYVTVPGGASRAFGPEFHPVAAGFEAASDETFVIGASHDRQKVRIWLEGSRGRLAWRGAERTQVI